MSQEKLKQITPDQEKQIPVYLNKYLNKVFRYQYYEDWNLKEAEKLIEWQYAFCGEANPMVIEANNPYEAQVINYFLHKECEPLIDIYLANRTEENYNAVTKIINERLASFDPAVDKVTFEKSYVFTSDIYANVLLGWFGYLIDVLKLTTTVDAEFHKWRELYEKAGVYSAICNDKAAIVSKYPKRIYRNEAGELNNTTGTAIEWDGLEWKCYYINGRQIPTKEYEMALNNEITPTIYNKEENQDIRAAWYEILGQEKMLEILGAVEIDRGQINHNDGSVEEVVLYKTKNTFPETGDNPYAWVKFICPSTGTNYLIDVEPRMTNAIEAAVSTSPLVNTVDDYKFDERA
jgi:hypothetical protein